MNDNEKRAHDIALEITSIANKAILESKIHLQKDNSDANNPLDVRIIASEFFNEYEQAYEFILAHLDK